MKTKRKNENLKIKKSKKIDLALTKNQSEVLNHLDQAWLNSIVKLKQHKYQDLEQAKAALLDEIFVQLKIDPTKNKELVLFLNDLCESDPEIMNLIEAELI